MLGRPYPGYKSIAEFCRESTPARPPHGDATENLVARGNATQTVATQIHTLALLSLMESKFLLFRVKVFNAPVSQAFCDQCRRIRLTSDGKIRICLFSQSDHDLYGA
jgi:molybdenum cofactor biosynthesis enzyme MoaA